ncbi:oligosaccharide flippase family protein [Thermoflexus sp.]|uniref:oligosaccharide flippase family protein n=1 Tax=Thermoflexus sp. TaxID=1969742 RepID=UPI0035E413AB
MFGKIMMRFWDSMVAPFTLSRKQVVQLTSVTIATAFNNLVGFVVNVVAAKKLGVEGFGVFSLAFSVATLAGAIGDFGFNLAMIRLFNKYQANPEKQTMILGTALGLKGALFALLAVTSLPLSSFLAWSLGVGSVNSNLFAIALITGGFLFIWTYLQAYLQAYRSFKQLTGYILAYCGLRLACLLVAYKFFPEDPLAWLAATYTAPLFVLTLIGVAPSGREAIAILFKHPDASLGIFRELLNYSKWVAISAIAYTAMPYLVRFILAVRGSVEEVGIFSAGMTFTVAFSTLNTAIRAVLFPQVTAFREQQIRRYSARLSRVAPYYVAFAIVGITALGLLQWSLLGKEYREALPVFLVTSGALATVIFLGLATMLVHTLMKPHVDAYTNIFRLMATALFCLLISPLNALGAAAVYGVVLVIGELGMLLYLRRIGRETVL